ncbi:COMM domain-containing protein 7 [Cricetulus griseus]|nr:COMM domain-containing protein 7 [Cricetulus griseus]
MNRPCGTHRGKGFAYGFKEDVAGPSSLTSPFVSALPTPTGKQFSALTEVLFHFLTEPKEVEHFLAQLSEFATTNQISLGPLKSIIKSLLLVPNGALKKGLTAEQVRADLLTLGLSEEKATYFSEKWKQNAPTLAQWAIGQTLMINQLVDMEWRFGVTSGSSELEKVGSIFLQLKLVVKKGKQMENVYIGPREETKTPVSPEVMMHMARDSPWQGPVGSSTLLGLAVRMDSEKLFAARTPTKINMKKEKEKEKEKEKKKKKGRRRQRPRTPYSCGPPQPLHMELGPGKDVSVDEVLFRPFLVPSAETCRSDGARA